MSLAVGPPIDGLTFLEHLGAGGYSDVYLYERQRPKMRVAVKVLSGELFSDAELAQFAAEAETMAELADHPYIVQVFWTGATTDGRPYLVMKYYPPPNLGKKAETQRFGIAEVLRTGIQIGSAVETAHRAGILHRDIKPANILISQYNEPGLTDFGIAGHTQDPADEQDLGVSIPWCAPEVLSGSSNGSAQSDVYSLAASIWHLLGGRSPFEVRGGDNSPRALMGRVLRTQVPSTGRADVPPSLERLLQQAMSKSSDLRPRSALEFIRGLQGVEQELRLARTEIVVDNPSVPTPRGQDFDTSPEATRMRASRPMPVADHSPRSEAPAPTAAGPRGVIDSVPQPGGTGARILPLEPEPQARRSIPADWNPPTSLRPTRATGSVPSQPIGRQDTDSRTVARGARPAAPATDEENLVREPIRVGRFRASRLAMAAGGAVVVAVAIAVATAGGSGKDASAANQAPQSEQGTANNPLGNNVSVAAPNVVCHYNPTKRQLTFTWTEPPSSATSYWTYQLRTPEDQNPQTLTTNTQSLGPITAVDPSQYGLTITAIYAPTAEHATTVQGCAQPVP